MELLDTPTIDTQPLLLFTPPSVSQWSSRMGGPSGAEIGRVCRGV